MPIEKYPTSSGDLMAKLAELEARVQKLERGPSNPTQTVFHNSAGDVLMRAGADPETGEKGFTVGRDDGKTALMVSGETTKVFDRTGQVIVSDAPGFESGLGRPSISAMVNKVGALASAQTSLIYVTVAEAFFRRSNPAIEVVLQHFTSDGATGIQLRFRDGDTFTQLGPVAGGALYEPSFSPSPAAPVRFRTPPLLLPPGTFPVGGEVRLIVEAQKISGAGPATFTVDVLAVRGADVS